MQIRFPLWAFYILAITACLSINTYTLFNKTDRSTVITIMLDPAGDAQHAGRKLDDSFERGITLQFAEQLKKILEEEHSNIRVVLTRFPGETLEPLQNASFANRLRVDFYLSIHFYMEKSGPLTLSMYNLVTNPVTDLWQSYGSELALVQYDKIHKVNLKTTQKYTELMSKVLNGNDYKRTFVFKGPIGIPFRPLVGINAPAIAIEAGLKNKNDWKHYLSPIACSLTPVINLMVGK